MGVARDRQGRVRRNVIADLGKDPDEVEVQPVAGGKRSRDVDVVEGIRVGRVGIEREQGHADDEGEQVQGDRDPHGRCSVAPGSGPSDRYESAIPSAAWRFLRADPSVGWRRGERQPAGRVGLVGDPAGSARPPFRDGRRRSRSASRRSCSTSSATRSPMCTPITTLATRLNAGQPLYAQPAGVDEAAFYRYPPLLAIVFRPLALLPFEAAAAVWIRLPCGPAGRDALAGLTCVGRYRPVRRLRPRPADRRGHS